MRKIIILLALALAVGLGSCSKEKHTFEIKDGKDGSTWKLNR